MGETVVKTGCKRIYLELPQAIQSFRTNVHEHLYLDRTTLQGRVKPETEECM